MGREASLSPMVRASHSSSSAPPPHRLAPRRAATPCWGCDWACASVDTASRHVYRPLVRRGARDGLGSADKSPRARLWPRGTALAHRCATHPPWPAAAAAWPGRKCPQSVFVLSTQALGGGGRVQELSLDGRPLQAQPSHKPRPLPQSCTPAHFRASLPPSPPACHPLVTPGARVPRGQPSLRCVCRLAAGTASPVAHPHMVCLETRVDHAVRDPCRIARLTIHRR